MQDRSKDARRDHKRIRVLGELPNRRPVPGQDREVRPLRERGLSEAGLGRERQDVQRVQDRGRRRVLGLAR